MTFNHGMRVSEAPTSIVPPITVNSALPVVIGTAPINMGNLDNVNKPVLCYSYKEAVEEMGFVRDFSAGFSLCEVIYSQFVLYGVAPVIFINVLDPVKHKTPTTDKAFTFANGELSIEQVGILRHSLKITLESVELKEGVDYDVLWSDKGGLLIKAVDGGMLEEDADVLVSFERLDPSLVTPEDIIGGIDANSGLRLGAELIEEVYPRFGLVPAVIAAPAYSSDVSVALILTAKSKNINGIFKAVAVCDIEAKSVKKYSDAVGFKNDNSLIDPHLILTFPKVKLDNDEFYLSTHFLGVMALTDSVNGGFPYKSPSNEKLVANAFINNGAEVFLTKDEANFLNANGIVTGLNFAGGYKTWGNRASAYPSNADVKDNFIPLRRMFAFIANTILLTYWSKVDMPITMRKVKMVLDSVQYWFNALTAQEIILGGRIEFREDENPSVNLMDGKIKYHLFFTPPVPAEDVEFVEEYDVSYLQNLFK